MVDLRKKVRFWQGGQESGVLGIVAGSFVEELGPDVYCSYYRRWSCQGSARSVEAVVF